MKYFTFLASVVFFGLLLSCSEEDKFEVKQTRIEGRVFDLQRNIPISGFEIRLNKNERCIGGPGGSYPCPNTVATVFSDADGYYEIVFDYVLDGDGYGFEKIYKEDYYYSKFIKDEHPTIIAGETNILDIDAWKPVYLKINLQVENNNDPSLYIDNKVYGYTKYPISFEQASIFETNKDTIVYLQSKPNAEVELNFHYNTGTSNSDFHSLKDIIQTTLQDTISLNYSIDCSTF